jgi:hypothetical protein
MPKFMMILTRPPQLPPEMTPQQLQATGMKLRRWMEDLQSSERYVVSDKLMDEGGKVVTQSTGSVAVTDGPFSEAKEVIGGYFTIRAKDYDEALAVARGCPFLTFGSIMVRQTDPMGCGDE